MAKIKNQKLIDSVASRVKQLREAKGITLEVFYHDTNIHLARIKAGRADITISTLEVICAYFGISLDEFFSEGF
jgi:transcriptional regulator with XRE-family HTH domain